MRSESNDAVKHLSPFVRMCGEYELPVRFRRDPYSIHEHEYIFIISGTAGYRIGSETYTLKPCDLLLVPPHVMTASWNNGSTPVRFYAMHFDFFYDARYLRLPMRRLRQDERPHPTAHIPALLQLPRIINCRDIPGIRTCCENIIDEMHARSSGYDIAVKARLLDMITRISRHGNAAQDTHVPKRLADVVRFMEKEYARDIRLIDIARSIKLNQVYFERIFKQYFNMPPMRYLMQLRIERAKVLLAGQEANIRDIARACGFTDPYHFSKTFRRVTGVAPRMFRRSADSMEGIAVARDWNRLQRTRPLDQGFS